MGPKTKKRERALFRFTNFKHRARWWGSRWREKEGEGRKGRTDKRRQTGTGEERVLITFMQRFLTC